MPKLNTVDLWGVVSDPPAAKYNAEGEIIKSSIRVLVMHGNRDYGERQVTGSIGSTDVSKFGYNYIHLTTKDPEITNIIKGLVPYDLIYVKGVLRVEPLKKKCSCKECGEKIVYPSNKTSVYPLHIERLRCLCEEYNIHNPDELEEQEESLHKEAMRFLRARVEVSNRIMMIGAICDTPELFVRDRDRLPILSFPLAVKRTYYVPEDDMSANADFPYIKVYGENAKEQSCYLRKGNLILLSGFVRDRSITRKKTCENCGSTVLVEDYVTEVVPYSLEYLRQDVTAPDVVARTDPFKSLKLIGSEAEPFLKETLEEMDEAKVDDGFTPAPSDQAILDAVNKLE